MTAPAADTRPTAPACDYCGLPIGGWWATQPVEQQPAYCCFGCQFAAAVARDSGDRGHVNGMLARLALGIFLSLNVMVFTMALWSQDVYGEAGPLAEPIVAVFRYLGLLFSLPVVALLGWPLLESACHNLRHGRWGVDLLLVLGIVAALIYSAVSTFRGAGHVYYEVACLVPVMVTLGRWLEATGRLKTTEALDALARLLPEQVRRVAQQAASHHHTTTIPLAEVALGDWLRVLAGERFPTDGVVVYGSAQVDQQLVTGESRPVERHPGDRVVGGTLNLDGDIVLRVAATPAEGTLQRLIDAVHAARHTKGHYQRLADRVAAWFTPAVTAIALATLFAHGLAGGWNTGLLSALAVLLIACPCALGLATPLAIWAALGSAARHQVVFRHGAALEQLADVRCVAFDKTGTLSTGQPRVAEVASPAPQAEVRRLVAAVAGTSRHPLSAALVDWADGDTPAAPRSTRVVPGRGVASEFPQSPTAVWLGSPRWMGELQLRPTDTIAAAIQRAECQGQSIVCLGYNDQVQAVFAFDEQLRPEAAAALADCRALGLQTVVLSGDHAGRGRQLAEALKLPVRAELSPDDKVAALADLRRQYGPTAMVGDGINDAPALAASDVGLALGCGADVSRDSADVCLLGNDLRRVAWSIDLARRTIVVVRQNLFWSFAYNTAGIGLACAGWLNPIWAAAAMLVSSLLVIGNSLRLAPAVEPVDYDRAPPEDALRAPALAPTAEYEVVG